MNALPPPDASRDPTARGRIPVIGIVGGVGSGKSSVARKFSEIAPAAIVDADRLGHEALELPEVQAQLRARFGEDIFDEGGKVVRSRLAARVFGDSAESRGARAILEGITHPEIGRMAAAQIAAERAASRVRWIVLDAALLQEAGWDGLCDAVVYVDVSADRRAERARLQRGWSEEEWHRREASQWPVERKRSAADLVISNEGTVEEAARALQEALEQRFA
jgi:dephospho-CoA kinase